MASDNSQFSGRHDMMSEPQKWAQLAVIVILALVVAWCIVRWHSAGIGRQAILIRIVALNLLVLGVGIGAGSYFASFFPPIFAITATGILTFFGLLSYALQGKSDSRIEDRDLRVAIAGSITTMYLVLVGYGVWVESTGTPDPIAQNLMNSFSTVVGTVIAFYFGASAYTETRTANRTRTGEDSRSTEPNPE
jgi:ABC-type xylose transport system permease subunit